MNRHALNASIYGVLVTEMLKLAPSPEQADALLATMRACNAAATRAAEVAFEHRTANKIRLQPTVYADLRETFKLSSQMAVRAISKACEAYKRDKKIKPVFTQLGAVAYDQRILSWKGRDRVSILTLGGRIVVPVVWQGRWLGTTGTVLRGAADLIWRDGKFYLTVVIDVPEPPAGPEPDEWLGVDLGIVNIAADSDGTTYCGKAVRAVRYRNRQLRARLQSKGTKSAKRLLASRRRKEARFARDVNHCISKALVSEAKDTRRGIKLEDLSGINTRATVRKAQRADRLCWSFFQLRAFIAYKATLAGVPVALAEPQTPPEGAQGAATSTSGTAGSGHVPLHKLRPRWASRHFRSQEHLWLGSRDAAGRGVNRDLQSRARSASPRIHPWGSLLV